MTEFDDDPTCAASGAGCNFVYMERFKSWGCSYGGRDATEAETLELNMPTKNAPVQLTLDDVSTRINSICADYLADAKSAKTKYETRLSEFSDAIDASPDLDKDAIGKIVFGRVKRLLAEVAEAVG
jgi:hypothetical protein